MKPAWKTSWAVIALALLIGMIGVLWADEGDGAADLEGGEECEEGTGFDCDETEAGGDSFDQPECPADAYCSVGSHHSTTIFQEGDSFTEFLDDLATDVGGTREGETINLGTEYGAFCIREFSAELPKVSLKIPDNSWFLRAKIRKVTGTSADGGTIWINLNDAVITVPTTKGSGQAHIDALNDDIVDAIEDVQTTIGPQQQRFTLIEYDSYIVVERDNNKAGPGWNDFVKVSFETTDVDIVSSGVALERNSHESTLCDGGI